MRPPELNLWVRTAPRGAEQFHWHIDIAPRLTVKAGFELGTGVDINIYPAGARRRRPAGVPPRLGRRGRPAGTVSTASSRPGKRALEVLAAQRAEPSRCPRAAVRSSPASRSTRKWCVRVDLPISRAKLPQARRGSSLAREFADDPQPLRVAERVQHGGELDLTLPAADEHLRRFIRQPSYLWYGDLRTYESHGPPIIDRYRSDVPGDRRQTRRTSRSF